jgi:3-deoxy-D-manno-octulosonic-acid transferase
VNKRSVFNIFWFFLYPILNWILPLFITSLKERRKFELDNCSNPAARSFSKDLITADLAFEVSSEGELEQVKPLIIKSLDEKMNVELIYCSDSVRTQCEKLYQKYSDNLRVLRMPLITYKFNNLDGLSAYEWLTAKRFHLCRYDFFPELLFYGEYKADKFYLLSATLKNMRFQSMGLIKTKLYEYVYGLFSAFVVPTQKDKDLLRIHYSINPNDIEVFDFRLLQINHRLDKKIETLEEKIPGFNFLKDLIEETKDNIVFGSFWANEVSLFDENFLNNIKTMKALAILVPHDLSNESLGKIKINIRKQDSSMPIYIIDNTDEAACVQKIIAEFREKPGFIILNIKGVLCEFYSLFKCAFVGGGHSKSVHSLLEPYLAGCNLLCGPKIHRSTEYDIIHEKSCDHIEIVSDFNDFSPKLNKMTRLNADLGPRSQLVATLANKKKYMNDLLIGRNET